MPSMGMKGTKWTIFTTSIEMFAEKNYHIVSLRDIAKNVGIKASSIYNHFESKEELLDQILEYFEHYFDRHKPDLGKLLMRAETDDPIDVLTSCMIRFDPKVEPIMRNIMKIATNEMRTNERAERLMEDYFIKTPSLYIKTLLDRMIELERIKPIDTELMAMLYSSYCFSSALRANINKGVSTEEWEQGMRRICQLADPIAKSKRRLAREVELNFGV